jgi:hypothetical protein
MPLERKPKPTWLACLLLGCYAVVTGALTWIIFGKEFGQGIVVLGAVGLTLSAVLFARARRNE